MKTILLLGASADQLFAIRTAKQMGLRVVVVDMNPDSPGFALADQHAVISTRDVAGLKEYADSCRASGQPIDGVAVMGSDIPQVVCKVAEHLGTPHIPTSAAILSTQKYDMKCRFRERGIPIPWFTLLESSDHLERIAAERGLPLVIKPVDRSGARGVFYLRPQDDLRDLYEEALRLSFSGRVMAEEHLPGLQISTESIMWRGKAYTPGFADRNYEMFERYAPNIIENGGWVPSSLDSSERAAVEDLVERAALALGVNDGVVKGDVVVTPDGPKMIEMAARLSGGDFAESLIPIGCGVNIVEAALNIALGRTPDLEALRPTRDRAVANRYFFPSAGRLVAVEGAEQVRRQRWIEKLDFWYRPGDIVPPVRNHADRFGVFLVSADDRNQLEERVTWVYDTVQIIIDGSDMVYAGPETKSQQGI